MMNGKQPNDSKGYFKFYYKKTPRKKPGLLGNQWGSNPRPSEPQSDALTN